MSKLQLNLGYVKKAEPAEMGVFALMVGAL